MIISIITLSLVAIGLAITLWPFAKLHFDIWRLKKIKLNLTKHELRDPPFVRPIYHDRSKDIRIRIPSCEYSDDWEDDRECIFEITHEGEVVHQESFWAAGIDELNQISQRIFGERLVWLYKNSRNTSQPHDKLVSIKAELKRYRDSKSGESKNSH